MDDKTLVERCSICGCQLDAPADPTSRSCGGDCLSCMALVAEDPACMGAYIEAQATRIEALEAALRFYARENNWKSCGVYMSGKSQSSAAEIDRGQRARQALEGSGNG